MKKPRWIRIISLSSVLFGALLAINACSEKKPSHSAPKPTAAIAAPTVKPEAKHVPAPAPAPVTKAAPVVKYPGNMVGWVENVILSPSGVNVKAKLDTGAKTSSVRAEVIKVFTKDGKKRVLYSIVGDDGENKVYDSALNRWVRIKKKEGGYVRRPVITMEICLAGHQLKGEVNLADRPNMIYPVLIGRNMLQNKFVLNPGKTFLTQPVCKAPAA
ncbi:MAG: RimK/LysX family protein [Rickettsiales bacterium]